MGSYPSTVLVRSQVASGVIGIFQIGGAFMLRWFSAAHAVWVWRLFLFLVAKGLCTVNLDYDPVVATSLRTDNVVLKSHPDHQGDFCPMVLLLRTMIA